MYECKDPSRPDAWPPFVPRSLICVPRTGPHESKDVDDMVSVQNLRGDEPECGQKRVQILTRSSEKRQCSHTCFIAFIAETVTRSGSFHVCHMGEIHHQTTTHCSYDLVHCFKRWCTQTAECRLDDCHVVDHRVHEFLLEVVGHASAPSCTMG